MPSNSSLFISTVSAKQMARETEICAAMINELNHLLYEEREHSEALRARNEALSTQLHAAKASARTARRRTQRKLAALRKRFEEADRYALELSHAVEEEKQRADEFAEDYATLTRRYQYRREDCDILRARCEEREAEIAEMRAHAQKVAEDAAVEREELYIKHATHDELMMLMEALPSGETLPVPPCLNPEEEGETAARDRKLNKMKTTNPLKFYLDGKKYMREFLLRWHWYHKRLPGEGVTPISGTPIPGWGGEGADDEADEGTNAGVFNCHCCDCDDADERDA